MTPLISRRPWVASNSSNNRSVTSASLGSADTDGAATSGKEKLDSPIIDN
jgi:hypothetical protein